MNTFCVVADIHYSYSFPELFLVYNRLEKKKIGELRRVHEVWFTIFVMPNGPCIQNWYTILASSFQNPH